LNSKKKKTATDNLKIPYLISSSAGCDFSCDPENSTCGFLNFSWGKFS